MNKRKEKLVSMLLDAGAVKLNPEDPFLWASGYRMPVYNDNRVLLQKKEYRTFIAESFAEILTEEGVRPDVVAGTATAGIPHATTLADLLDLPLVYIRGNRKDHGMNNVIEGLPGGSDLGSRDVVLVEDLVSTGRSSLRAAEAVKDAGGALKLCLAIFSYGFPEAADSFAALDPPCPLIPLLTYDDLIEAALKEGTVSEPEYRAMAEWREDPFVWGEKRGFGAGKGRTDNEI